MHGTGPYRVVDRLRQLRPSSIRTNMRIAAEVGAINLAQGRPDFPAAAAVKMAAISAIANDENQYSVTWGLEELRQAVAEMLSARYGISADPGTDITITCGVTEAMVDAMLATVQAGDEVIVLEPAHENYVPAIRFAGAEPVFVTLEAPEFRLDLDQLRDSISKRTRLLILNSPNNPSGRVFTRDETEAIAELAMRHGFLVLTDEIYDRLVYGERVHVPIAGIEGMRAHTITTGGISKIHCVTGWRLGYVVAPAAITGAIRLVHDYSTICAPTPLQHAGVRALSQPESYYEHLLSEFELRRARMMKILEVAGFEALPPEGAYYVLASFGAWQVDDDDEAFAGRLITDAGVATVPGSAFYYGRPHAGAGLVRFAFARSFEVLDEVEARLVAAFERHRGH